MLNGISNEIIIGNALISLKKPLLSKGEIYHYLRMVKDLLPKGYFIYKEIEFEEFCEKYNFILNRVGDSIKISYNNKELEKYFRIGVSIELIRIFEASAQKLKKLEKNNQNNKVKIIKKKNL